MENIFFRKVNINKIVVIGKRLLSIGLGKITGVLQDCLPDGQLHRTLALLGGIMALVAIMTALFSTARTAFLLMLRICDRRISSAK